MSFRRQFAWLVVFSCTLTVSAAAQTPVRYDGYKTIVVNLTEHQQIEQMRDLQAILMPDAPHLGRVEYVVPPGTLPLLDSLDIEYKVLDSDLQKHIDAERARMAKSRDVGPRDIAWYQEYKSFAQYEAKLAALAADYPDLCTLVDIGDSLQGRDIWALHITAPGGDDKPMVLLNGMQHAREWISGMVVMWVADELLENHDTDPQIQSLLDRVEFVLIPVVNPDGYVYTDIDRLWRKNRRYNAQTGCYGVDPNRNWDAGWGGSGASGDPCDLTYYGAFPFSEPCTAALSTYMTNNPRVVSNIDFHSYSQLILWPFGYKTELPADNDKFSDLGLAMQSAIQAVHGEFYRAGPIADTLYTASGGSIDWCYEALGIFAFTFELRPDSAWPGFELPASEIIPTCEENWPAVLHLAEWSSQPFGFEFVGGVPTQLLPDTPLTIDVSIAEISAALDTSEVRLFHRVGGGAFVESPMTFVRDGRFQGVLPAVACGQTIEYYIAARTLDGADVFAPADAPDDLYTLTASPLITVLDEPMDVNPGWTTEGQWAWGDPTGSGGQYGGPDPNAGFSGRFVYGYNLNGDYENSLPERYLTTPALDCSGVTGVRLGFYRWLGVEQPLYDHASLRVSNNGTNWHTVWSNSVEIDDGQWVYCEYDISEHADNEPTVYIRWVMGETDGGWRYCGWNIDDVSVWGSDPDGCPTAMGDLNCDGVVDFGDINPFVLALTGQAGYEAEYPNCNWSLADINGDSAVDFGDINPFVALLAGS